VLSSLLAVTFGQVTVPKSILIVDDNRAVREATRDFLESQTIFRVCGEAIDGLDALDKARDLTPDLIILDLSMPRMNGLQAAKELKAIMEHVPIILFTLHAEALPKNDALPTGVNAVVSKVDLSGLARQVNKLLAGKRPASGAGRISFE
jgi:DNA-binding NarL/FixJ family response regulator